MDQAKSIYSFWFFNRVNRNLFFWATKDASLNVADIKYIIKSLLFTKDFKLFSNYKNDFNGIDGHALFIGTVMHSLDHYLMAKHADPLMFDVNCEKYGKMNEVLRFVRSSFVEKPPGLFFKHMYKGQRKKSTEMKICVFLY